MAQEKIEKHGGGDSDDEVDGGGPAGQERREQLGEDVDTILDEIDDV
ncbi:MAG: ubiquitin-like protein Pup, partial [Thermocrispum sp.]